MIQLKHLFTVALPFVLATNVGNAQFYNYYPFYQAMTEPNHSVTLLNIETPYRCQTDDLSEQRIITSVKYEKDDFQLTYIDKIDELPRYEVNGFTFDNMALDIALQKLLEEAKIEVYTDDESYVTFNAKDVYGELSIVVDELTKAGDTYYKYDDSKKRLNLSRRGNFELKLPNNRTLILGILDALRGAGIENVNPNWGASVLSLTLTRQEEIRVKELVEKIVKDGRMLVSDTQIYSIASIGNGGDWGQIIQSFGVDKVHSSTSGLMGKLIAMGHQKNSKALLNTIGQYYQPTLISEGTAVVPNGWKMRFDIGRCAKGPYMQNQLAVLLYPYLRDDDTINTQVTIDSANGELSTFRVNTAIDDELAVIGIPDQMGFGSELLVVMKLKLIRLIGGK